MANRTADELRSEITRLVSEHDIELLNASPRRRAEARNRGLLTGPSRAEAELADRMSPDTVVRADIDTAVSQLAADRGESWRDTFDQVMLAGGGSEDDLMALSAGVQEVLKLPRDATLWLSALGSIPRDDVTHTDVERAVRELARQRGETYEVTFSQVRALAGEKDAPALRIAALELAALPGVTFTSPDVSTEGLLALTAAERAERDDQIAKIASVRAARQAQAAEDEPAAVRALRQRLNRAGPDDGTISLSARTRAVLSLVGQDLGDEDLIQFAAAPPTDVTWHAPQGVDPEPSPATKILDVLNRSPHMFEPQDRKPRRLPAHFHQAGDDDYAEHPAGREVTTQTRAHGGRDHTDQDQPAKGGKVYPGIGQPDPARAGYGGADAIASDPGYAHLFTSNKPAGANTSHPPVPARLREFRELRARGGGRHQAAIRTSGVLIGQGTHDRPR
jgi:hypothetical protein